MSRPRTSTGWPRSSSTTGSPACAISKAANRPAGPLQGRTHGLEPECLQQSAVTPYCLLICCWHRQAAVWKSTCVPLAQKTTLEA